MNEETRIIIDMALLLLISGVCSIIFAKIRMPPIIGYLTAGIILGPTMLPELWVEANTVVLLSNLGIVLLMFYIGLETDINKLRKTGSKLVFIVCFQMPIVMAFGYMVGTMLGYDFVQSIFLGAIISGTSTAVVVGVLKESDHIDAETAKNIITITIFEDVGQVIILTMAAPLLAGDTPALGSTLYMIMGLILFLGLTIVFGMAVIPRMLDYIGKKYSSEILLIIAVGLCFATAAISAGIGLSIAIGAFIMGMMISISSFSHQIALKVEPVKDLFMAVFFISIGLQISPALILENIWLAVIIAVVFMVSKMVSVGLGCYLANMSFKQSFLIATSLLAMGEFAFIIAKLALDAGIVTPGFYSAVIGAALISMLVMPLLAKAQPRMLAGISARTPKKVRGALERIDRWRDTAAVRMRASATSKPIKKAVSLIFVDCMVIVVVMLVFNAFGQVQRSFSDVASTLHILPQELLLLMLILVISPAVHNIHSNVKTVSRSLTALTMESPKYAKVNEKYLYSIFLNVGNTAMLILLLVLIVPFIPTTTTISPVGLAIIVVCAIAILYLAWDTIRKGYDRFHTIVARNGDECDENGENA
jgi:CPA2 family monovalent cation:H+ antiporter-2